MSTVWTIFAQAGGGSSGFGGGGGGGGFGGGGGGFGGGGGAGGGSPILILLIVAFFGIVFVVGAIQTARMRRARRQRVERVELASAEAAADDEAFGADAVREQATALFVQIQRAWDARDRDRLLELVGDDLMVEWARRLDDFERKGWHNRVKVHGTPEVEYVSMTNRTDDADDRVTVRLEASLEVWVQTRNGGRIMQNGKQSAMTALAEYWTLTKRGDDDRWTLLSIEQDAEGAHHLQADIIASPWGDSERLTQDAIAEGAAAGAAPAGVSPGELVDLDFSGPVRAQAMDLALADSRFDVDLIEASVRRAVSAWAEAVDGDDAALEAAARPDAVRALLGDSGGRTRVVVRGPRVEQVTISALDAQATPPTLTVDMRVHATRYVEDRDTVALVSGSRDSATTFTERWTLALDAEGEWPWRIAATQSGSPA